MLARLTPTEDAPVQVPAGRHLGPYFDGKVDRAQ